MFVLWADNPQLSKIEMGKNRQVVCFCEGVTIVHISDHPLVLTFMAREVCRTERYSEHLN